MCHEQMNKFVARQLDTELCALKGISCEAGDVSWQLIKQTWGLARDGNVHIRHSTTSANSKKLHFDQQEDEFLGRAGMTNSAGRCSLSTAIKAEAADLWLSDGHAGNFTIHERYDKASTRGPAIRCTQSCCRNSHHGPGACSRKIRGLKCKQQLL